VGALVLGRNRRPHAPSAQPDLAAQNADHRHVRKAGGGQTQVTIRWSPIEATAEEQRTFDAAHDSMTQGWGGTFDRLAAYVAGASSRLSGKP